MNSGWGLYAALLVFLILAGMSQAFAANPGHGVQYAAEQIIAPLAAFAMARCALYAEHNFMHRSLSLILLIAAAEAVLALTQAAAQQWLPFEAYFRQAYATVPSMWTRYGGTLDHPLILGLLLSIAMWSLWIVPWMTVRLGLAALYLTGIGVTESRTAVIASVVGLMVMLVAAPLGKAETDRHMLKTVPLQRLAPLTVVAVAAVWMWNILLGSNAMQRFNSDGGSARDRQVVYGIFMDHMTEFFAIGGGSASSKDFALEHGSLLSFENPLMSYTVDYGFLAALFYVGVQLAIVARSFMHRPERRRGSIFVSLTALVAIVITQSFSQQAADAMLLWLVLALASGPAAGQRSALGQLRAPVQVAAGAGGGRPQSSGQRQASEC